MGDWAQDRRKLLRCPQEKDDLCSWLYQSTLKHTAFSESTKQGLLTPGDTVTALEPKEVILAPGGEETQLNSRSSRWPVGLAGAAGPPNLVL